MIRSRIKIPVFVAFLSPMLLGCDAGLPVSPSVAVDLDRSSGPAVSRPRLAVCPITTTERVSGRIGSAGGSLELAGHRLTIPAGALKRPTHFTLTAPAGTEALSYRAVVANKIEAAGEAAFKVDAAWTIKAPSARIRRSADKDELIVPVTFKDGKAAFTVEYVW